MHVRLETPHIGILIPYAPERIRHIESRNRYVYWYAIPIGNVDHFFRSVYHYYNYYWYEQRYRDMQYYSFGLLSLRYRGDTLNFDLAHSLSYPVDDRQLRYVNIPDTSLSFFPLSYDIWEYNTDAHCAHYSNVRAILSDMAYRGIK